MALRGRLFPIPTPQARPPQEELAPGGEDWQAEGALRAAPFVPPASSVFSLGLPWVSLPLFHSALLRMHSGRLLTTSTGRQPARVTVSGGKWEEGSRRVQGGRSTRLRGPGRA